MIRQEDQEESVYSIMSHSLPKCFQQSSTTPSYSRSSSSTPPISIAESTSDSMSETIDGSISSMEQYYNEKTWAMYYRIVNQRKLQQAYRKNILGHAMKLTKRRVKSISNIQHQNDVCQECDVKEEEKLPCIFCLKEAVFELEMDKNDRTSNIKHCIATQRNINQVLYSNALSQIMISNVNNRVFDNL
ncbi:predicted protein [Chaetoceros tenuissimus]|uniref:Uncharacterized protein n=1 Tax=Chaetoceros tenuissimus TaxID=426638 RepID=A0AAD3D1Z0_9STRA|nr:predicted protein [Chaetoceros tenuissimus]